VLHGAFRARLAELGIRDRAGGHGRAAELLETRLEAWDDSPVFAYGFEDMSGVQLAALRALAARCTVMVSLPYEPGRPALAAVRPAVAALTGGPHELVELPPVTTSTHPPCATSSGRCSTSGMRRRRQSGMGRSCCSRPAACAASPTRSRSRRWR
jgi:hypothetical protein